MKYELAKGFTHKELVSMAKKVVEWVTDESKDDKDGRYWLNVYHGAGVYELIIQNGRIVGSIEEGFYPTIPQVDGHNAITREQWIDAITEVINERIGDNWHFAKADGSGTYFFLRECPEDEELRSYVKMYMVKDRNYNWHTNYEITSSKQKNNDHPLLASVEFDWRCHGSWYVKCPICGEIIIDGVDVPIPDWTKCKCSKNTIYINRN